MDLKEIVEAIKAETDPEKQKKLLEQYGAALKTLEEKADKFKEVEEKGIFKELKETREKLLAMEKTKKELEEAEAKEQGKYKELVEAKDKEIDELKVKYELEKAEADESRIYKQTKRKDLLAKLTSDEDKDIANSIKGFAQLEKFVMSKITKPPLSVDEGGKPKPPDDGTELTTDEIRQAKEMFSGADDPIKEFKEYKKTYKKDK